jgi:hypothetical protein
MKIEPRSVERQLGRVDRQQRNGPSVKTLFPRTLAGALLSGAVTVVGMGLAPGIAHADGGPYTWCPGQSMEDPSGPNRYGNQYVWDMNVCHT